MYIGALNNLKNTNKSNMSHLKTVMRETILPKNTAIVDVDTGEVKDVEVKSHKVLVGKDEFYLTYSYFINALQKDMTIGEIKVFSFLLQHYGAATKISINKVIREDICKEVGLTSITTVSNVLKSMQLKSTPLIYKVGRGTYMLNPRYAFKGGSSLRNNQLKTIIELGCKNC